MLWWGSSVAQLGAANAAIASALLALSLTRSTVVAGFVAAAGTGSRLLFYLPAGMIADRFDRRRVMLVCQYTRLTVAALLVLGLLLGGSPGWLLAGAAAAEESLMALYRLAEPAVVRRVVPPPALLTAMGRNEARTHIAQLLGRPVGGLLCGVHRTMPFVADALTSLLAAVALHCMSTRDCPAPRKRRDAAQASGLRACAVLIRSDTFLSTTLLWCTVTNAAFQIVFLTLVVQVDREWDSFGTGWLLAIAGVGGAFGAWVASRLVRDHRTTRGDVPLRVMVWCAWGWVAVTGVAVLGDSSLSGLLAWAGLNFIGAHVNVALNLHLASRVPDSMCARVNAISALISQAIAPLGSLSAGFLLSLQLDTRIATSTATTLALIAATFTTYRHLQVRKRRDPGLLDARKTEELISA